MVVVMAVVMLMTFIKLFIILLLQVIALMNSCGKPKMYSSSDRRQVYETQSTSREIHRHGERSSFSKYVSTSGEYSEINSGFQPDTPVTLHREAIRDPEAPTLYTTYSQQVDTLRDIISTGISHDSGALMAEHSGHSVPGYSYQLPASDKPPTGGWDSFAWQNMDYLYDNSGYVGDSTITYF
ncbi:hypothetical protein LSH36_867g00052 [Paralvinella palmiformis]|uniref:Uncharacterized protein n=1 Tax=Paralvinella palmiformis TaxID=53620 RepID=A0AAD9IYH1_9ANNE|nr:hypothetical protein LSH36_867g00052 [Paralvinella palmiformis]